MNLNIKWYYLLIIGALVGSGITIFIFNQWLKPDEDTYYKDQYAIEHANNLLLQKEFRQLKEKNIILQQKVHDDSTKAFTDLHNIPSIHIKYVTIHDSVGHLDDDGTVNFTKSRLPNSDPY